MMRPNAVTMKSKHNQNGAVLAVALIILFLLSILGLAVMKTSSLEEKMAANTLHQDIAFQAAETVSENAISDPQNLSDAFNSADGTIQVPFSNPQLPNITANSIVSFVGPATPTGTSLSSGSGLTNFLYIANSTGSIDQSNTSTTIIQGFSRLVPTAN